MADSADPGKDDNLIPLSETTKAGNDNEELVNEEESMLKDVDPVAAKMSELVVSTAREFPNLHNQGANVPQYNWVDITEDFTEAAQELALGELVHDNTFGLFEAMSAIEMMDPKMDAGMLCNKAKKVLQFEPAVKAGAIKVKDFTPAELIGIMDELIACLVTWLDGHSLVQTVFICLYMHDPFLIEDPCLKAFCLAVLKSCDFIRVTINRAQVFEEEDFQSMTYGFKMGGQVSETRAAGMLKEAEEEVARKIKGIRHQMQGDCSGNLSEMQSQIREHEAVLTRLKFFKAFYCTLVALDKPDCSGVSTARQLLNSALSLLEPLRKTLDWGVKPQGTSTNSQGSMAGFEQLVNQRLLPPSFPRYTAIFGREQALDYLEAALRRIVFACSVVEHTSLHVVIDFVSEFSKKKPCVLSRSVLQLLVWQNNKMFGRLPSAEVTRDAIRAFNSPPSISEKSSLSNNPKARELSDGFMNRAVRPMRSVVHTLGHNRARQRDKLGHLLDEFAALQDEADKVDAQLHTLLIKVEPKRQHFACFGSWVLYHTLNVMVQYLLSGFELALYSTHEYHYIFWYLDFLFGWHMTCLNRAEKLLHAQLIAVEHKSGRSGKKNKKKKKVSEKAIQEHQGMRHLYQGMRHLCQGYMRAIEAFHKEGKMKKPNFEFGSEQKRFERRFLPFQAVDTPQPMFYAHYKEYSDMSKYSEVKITDRFLMACKAFQEAKTIFEVVANVHEEVTLLLKVTKTNLVVTKLAAGGHKQDSQIPPDFDFSVHRAFPIIRLT